MNARLVCLDTVSPSPDVTLERFPLLIGRGPDADVQLRDEWVSRIHCLLSEAGDVLHVRDLGSRHGTFVNGERVDECPLHPGDELRVGLSTFRVSFGPESARWPSRFGHSGEGSTDQLSWRPVLK